MIGNQNLLKKITMTTGVIAMSVGLMNAFSLQAQVDTTTGGKLAAWIGNCTDGEGHVYAFYTDCKTGSTKCVSTKCPPPPLP